MHVAVLFMDKATPSLPPVSHAIDHASQAPDERSEHGAEPADQKYELDVSSSATGRSHWLTGGELAQEVSSFLIGTDSLEIPDGTQG
jgi:hypothetical protein